MTMMMKNCQTLMSAVTLKCFHQTTCHHCYSRLDCLRWEDCWHFYLGSKLHLDWFCYNPVDWWNLDCNPCCSGLKAFEGSLETSRKVLWWDPSIFRCRFPERMSQDDAADEPWSRDHLAMAPWRMEGVLASQDISQLRERSPSNRLDICWFQDSQDYDVAGTRELLFQGCLSGIWKRLRFMIELRMLKVYQLSRALSVSASGHRKFSSSSLSTRLWELSAQLSSD